MPSEAGKKSTATTKKKTTKKKTAAKKTTAKKSATKSSITRKSTTKKSTAKKSTTKRSTAKKSTSEKAVTASKAAPQKATAQSDKSPNKLRVRQVRSGIGYAGPVRRTLTALGLKHHQDEVLVPDNPSIRGMLAKVHHLISVKPEEANV